MIKSVTSEAASLFIKIHKTVADVDLRQVFSNRGTAPVEALFSFPLPADASIYSFEAVVDDKFVAASLKEKQSAENRYEDTIASGGTAMVANVTENDSFQLKLGNLQPQKIASTRLRFAVPLFTDLSSAAVRLFSMPAFKVWPTQGVKIEPIEVSYGQPVKITSPSHKITVQSKNPRHHFVDVDAESAKKTDLLLSFQITEAQPQLMDVIVSKKEGADLLYPYAAVIPVYVPRTSSQAQPEVHHEFVFIVDCSGSMGGVRITEARRAMKLFLMSLPPTCEFNIVRFGSSYQKLFPSSEKLSDTTLSKAKQYVQNTDANLGGTELLPCMKSVFQENPSHLIPKGHIHRRSIFIVTDGEVSNTKECIEATRAAAKTLRVFTMGIGAGVSQELVNGIAAAGGGSAQFVQDANDRTQAKVLSQLKDAFAEGLEDVKITWRFGGELKFAQTSSAFSPLATISCTRSSTSFLSALNCRSHGKDKLSRSLVPLLLTRLFRMELFIRSSRECS